MVSCIHVAMLRVKSYNGLQYALLGTARREPSLASIFSNEAMSAAGAMKVIEIM